MFIQLTKAFMGKPPGERIDVSDADAQGLISAGIAMAVPADDAINGLVQRLTGSIAESMTKSLDTIINATLAKFKDVQSQARKHAVPAIFGEGNDGDPKKNFGDWLYKVAKNDRAALEKDYGSSFNPWQKAALAEQSGVTGGYIVPPEFYDQLLTIAAEQNTFRQARLRAADGLRHVAVPVPGHHHGPGRRHVALLRRRQSQLDRRGPNAHRDRAAVQDDGAEGPRAVRLLRQLQRSAAGRRLRPGKVPDAALRRPPLAGTRSTPSCRATASASRWASSTPRPPSR